MFIHTIFSKNRQWKNSFDYVIINIVMFMKAQLIGIKWINNIPNILLYDFVNSKMIYKKIGNHINIINTNIKKCKGYYDLQKREYIPCQNFSKDFDNSIHQCEDCRKLSCFDKCIGCDGFECRTSNDISKIFCNQKHIVYLALFGNDRIKVGTAAEYRKYSRILDQGAVASVFIAETPTGKIARLIEHKISKLGYTLQVQSNYKINNLVIQKNKDEIKEFLEKEYEKIKTQLSIDLTKFFIKPEINYCEKMNEINKKCLLKESPQLSLFNDKDFVENYKINLDYSIICGNIINVVGSILIIEKDNIMNLYDLKRLEGYIIEGEME